jgi:hypothetical protein
LPHQGDAKRLAIPPPPKDGSLLPEGAYERLIAMGRELAKVESNGLWRGHLKVKGNSPVPSESEYDTWKMHDTGVSIPDIAEINSITEATVRKTVKKVESWFQSKCTVDIAGLKMRQHARLEALIETALEEFQSSGGKSITTVRKQIPGTNGEDSIVVEETVTEKESPRDVKYINTAAKLMSEQRAIWPGMNAPSASTITNSEGTGDLTISVEHVAKVAANLTDEELAALEKLDKMMDEEDVIDV